MKPVVVQKADVYAKMQQACGQPTKLELEHKAGGSKGIAFKEN